ncbi:MAG: hypothetical protein ACHP8A_18580 [Terriglobales bacterium]
MELRQKNQLLRTMLTQLAVRKIGKIWANTQAPYSALVYECKLLRDDKVFLDDLSKYLDKNPIIHQSVSTLLAHIAMAANARWQDTPRAVQMLSRRGWHIGRWIPTFLIIDGPLARLFKDKHSPIVRLLKLKYSEYPILSQARDIFIHDEFRLIRNGIGHWSFIWEDKEPDDLIQIFDEKTNRCTLTITKSDAEAFHLTAFSIVEILDVNLLTPANYRLVKASASPQ